jgi:hypothetical protein
VVGIVGRQLSFTRKNKRNANGKPTRHAPDGNSGVALEL